MMKIQNRTVLRSPLWSLCLILCACFISVQDASAQEILPGRLKSPITACLATDRVAVTALYMTPREPIPGQAATITMKIKNLCLAETDPLKNIYWEITKGEGGNVLHTGTIESLAGGATSTITKTMTGECGQHRFDGWVDQSNRIREAESARENNSKALTVYAANRTITRVVDQREAWNKAGYVGGFNSGTGDTGCLLEDNAQQGGTRPASAPFDRLTFKLRCPGLLGVNNVDFLAYYPKSGRLQNGWTVKSVSLVTDSKTGNAGFNKDLMPEPQGTGISARLRLWANARSSIHLTLMITIEGPECTDPFK